MQTAESIQLPGGTHPSYSACFKLLIIET